MSDIEVTMNFESLPNEILIECFEYLNIIDIFYSFDSLNSRFNKLIRTVPLHLSTEDIEESKLIQFCNRIASNSQIKQQIKSLTLSKMTPNAAESFSSFIRLEECSQLQILTIKYLPENLISRLPSILPLLTNLYYLCVKYIRVDINPILESLSNTTIKSLSIPALLQNITLTHPAVSLVNLIISRCTVESLCSFFDYSPSLRYLEIENIIGYPHRTIGNVPLHNNRQLIHLTRLVVHKFINKFAFLEAILQRTPNLKVLIISSRNLIDLVDAQRWEHLITTSLPFLKIFKFNYSLQLGIHNTDIVYKFNQFQTNFWIDQHHWYTEYVFKKDSALIYTVPYGSNRYSITPDTRRYYNESTNKRNAFANVTILQLSLNKTMTFSEYYFPNVKSLILKIVDVDEDDTYDLKTMVNLSNLIHLKIRLNWHLNSLIQLFKEAPYLSSLKVNKDILIQMIQNRELCEYFNKMIKRLDIIVRPRSFLNSDEISKVSQVFSNMENFRCHVGQADNLQLILNHLLQLPNMKIFTYKTRYYDAGNSWLKQHQSEIDSYSFTIKCESKYFQHNDDDDEYDSSDDDSNAD